MGLDFMNDQQKLDLLDEILDNYLIRVHERIANPDAESKDLALALSTLEKFDRLAIGGKVEDSAGLGAAALAIKARRAAQQRKELND